MVETEDESWIDKAEEERLEIIAKYDKGREEGHNIDPWEDPGFEIYHVTDFHGFIHDNRLPNIGADEIKRKNHEVERVDKWLKMHKGWEKYKNSEKLKKRVYKGIPNRLRGLFWSLLLDLEPLQNQQKGKYQEMYELARKYSPDIRQIDLDVNRTFRDHINFRERFGVKQKSLFNILSAYSIYNSEVGYCQGMSQIAALLLLYLNEEEAFWAFAQLMTHHRYAMHGFFIAGFPKLIRFQSHHDRVLTTMLPKLKKHFDKHCVDAGLYTLKWFFQCFLDRVPYELALRYWDIYLLEGEKVLTCGAYAILKMHNKNLLAKKNMDDILTYLQSKLPTNFDCDTDTAVKYYGSCSEELHRKKLDTAGEPGDEELVKKPFGVIDNILPNPPKKKPPRNTVSSTAKMPNSSSNISNDKTPVVDGVLTENSVPAVVNDSPTKPVHIVAEASSSTTPPTTTTLPTTPNHSLELENHSSRTSSPVIHSVQEEMPPLQDNNRPSSSLASQINKTPTIEMVENNSRSSSRNSQHQRLTPSPQPVHSVQNNRRQPPPVSPRKMRPVENIDVLVENNSRLMSHTSIKESIETTTTTGSIVENSSSSSTRRPPSVSPRHHHPPPPRTGVIVENNNRSNLSSHRHTIDVLESSNRSRSTTPSSSSVNIPPSTPSPQSLSNIPSGETVRIHVPYNACTTTTSSRHSFEVSTTTVTTSAAARNGFDLNKSDPNRIKIDVSLEVES